MGFGNDGAWNSWIYAKVYILSNAIKGGETLMNELFLIVTLCAGTTYLDIRNEAAQPAIVLMNVVNCEQRESYKLSALETWYCKYFGHRPGKLQFSLYATGLDYFKCQICNKTGKAKSIQKTETEWVWE